MPHLTPMNWILSILFTWFSMSTLNSIKWWSNPMLFSPMNQSTYKKHQMWSW